MLAVDIQQEMLDIVANRATAADLQNVEPLLATETDPRLPVGALGLVWVETKNVLPQQHFMVFRKP